MPWRKKPSSSLRYWTGPVNRTAGFKTVLVYCVGPAQMRSYHDACKHSASLKLEDLPDWDWSDISAHLRCTACGTVGYVDTRLNWSEVIDFNKGIG